MFPVLTAGLWRSALAALVRQAAVDTWVISVPPFRISAIQSTVIFNLGPAHRAEPTYSPRSALGYCHKSPLVDTVVLSSG
ncbi:hypothetical protein J6590_029243 [Homalodisca vitripennis]|nr:hypothetical protein J6590_029243 [Homalodisca vitripennis]